MRDKPTSRVWLGLALALLAGGCSSSGLTAEPITEGCGNPVRGQRYSVCGALSSGAGSATVGDRLYIGAVGSSQKAVSSSRYQLSKGTFHASP